MGATSGLVLPSEAPSPITPSFNPYTELGPVFGEGTQG